MKALLQKLLQVIKEFFASFFQPRAADPSKPVEVKPSPVPTPAPEVKPPVVVEVKPIVRPENPTPLTPETAAAVQALQVSQTDPRYNAAFDVWTPGNGLVTGYISEEEAQQYLARFK